MLKLFEKKTKPTPPHEAIKNQGVSGFMSESVSKHALKSIRCGRCGRVSYNQNDVKYRYCGHCKMFHA